MGSLIYLTHSQPNISYVVGSFSRYKQEPHEFHLKETKRILIYVKGTTSFGIHYAAGSSLDIVGYTYSDWAGNNTDHKSTSGYILYLILGTINWSSKKKSTITLSSTEVEYRGEVNVTTQTILLQHILTELGFQFHRLIVIWCDNQSTLKLCRDLV